MAPDYLQGAFIALDNHTAGILVLVGGRVSSTNSMIARSRPGVRPARDQAVRLCRGLRERPYPGSLVEDSALDNRAVMIGGTTGILGEWDPNPRRNRYEGPMTARRRSPQSKNGADGPNRMTVGVDPVIQALPRGRIRSPLRPFPATFLGSSEIPWPSGLAYNIFPNGGWRPNARIFLDRIEEKDGTVVWEAQRDRARQAVVKPGRLRSSFMSGRRARDREPAASPREKSA